MIVTAGRRPRDTGGELRGHLACGVAGSSRAPAGALLKVSAGRATLTNMCSNELIPGGRDSGERKPQWT